MPSFSSRCLHLAWECFCIASIAGIWPRYIEPRLLLTHRIDLPIAGLQAPLQGLRIVQFSDLHLSSHLSDRFLRRIKRRIANLQPDLLLFTGDFLCHGRLDEPQRLSTFLHGLDAPLGAFTVLGNHDYAEYISINKDGDYDVIRGTCGSPVKSAFHRLLFGQKLRGRCSNRVHEIAPHPELLKAIESSAFRLLHNETIQVHTQGASLNIAGLGDYWADRCQPQQAFKKWHAEIPGVALSHNPDSVRLLEACPASIILSGHTHGGQVNIPLLRERCVAMEHPKLRHGLQEAYGQRVYINRGIAGSFPVRFFSPPELTVFTLKAAEKG
jgi:predicted MPP superfamily phosphohydrolase